MERDLDHFVGFACRRLPTPSSNRIYCGLGQHGMPAFDFGIFHTAIRGDQSLDFDDSAKSHVPCQCWIRRSRMLQNSALRFLGLRL